MDDLASKRSEAGVAIKPEQDLESGQQTNSYSTTTTGDNDADSLPANISVVGDDNDEENGGGRAPERSHSKEAEIARQEAAQTAVALKKLPDDESPMFWSRFRKVKNNTILALATFALTYSSSVMTPSLAGISRHYHVSSEAAIVTLSLFVLGFGVGPFLMGPTSDVIGRRMVYVVSFGSFTAWSWGVAFAPNYAALIVFRFLAGLSGASALNNHPASISDFTNATDRGRFSVAYAVCAFLGASIGPLVGGFVVQRASWRWNLIVTAILVSVTWALILVGVDESFAPVLLARRNKHHKRPDGPSFASRYKLALTMPWKLLFTEPIVALTSLYLSILYAIFYAIFPIAPIIYVQVRGWSQESLALSYIAPTLGFIAGGLVILYGQEYAYRRIASKTPAGQKPPPDARFAIMLYFSWMVPVGIFLVAFCSYENTHWFGDTLGFFMLTMGTIIVFTGLIPFTIDLYLSQAAAALAAQVATRAIAACAFPLFSRQMFYKLGIPGASCLLGGITILLTAMPFIFKKYGSRLWDK